MLSMCLLTACVPKDRGAAEAYERGDYAAAAETYDRLLAEKPNDAGLRQRRDDARLKAHARQLARLSQPAPPAGAMALTIAELSTLLLQRDRWTPGQLSLGDPQLDAALAFVEDGVRRQLADELHASLRARQLLGAEARLAAHQQALPFADFVALWPQLTGELRAAAAAHCQAAMPAQPEASPYLTSLLTSYCSVFGAPVPPPISLGLANAVTLSVSVEGVSQQQAQATGSVVSMGFMESPWYDPASPRQLTGTISGRNDFWFTAREETLEAPWSEQVAYEDTETYQEPYTDTETYYESVPSTVYRSESYPCGTSTCTREVPETEYNQELRTRTVTKYRTATRSITRFRTEERSHSYRALRRDGRYAANWQVALQLDALPGEAPISFPVTAGITQYGYDHDETFAPADLSPGRANLMTPAAWFDYVAASLGDRLRDQLQLRWQASYCRQPSYTVETAARCARGAVPPPAARATLAQLLGGDTDLALQRLTRWGAQQQVEAPRP